MCVGVCRPSIYVVGFVIMAVHPGLDIQFKQAILKWTYTGKIKKEKRNKRSRSRTHTEVLKILISNLGSKAVKI